MVGDLFFFTWKAKNQPILSINAVSPERAKRRILAALWRSPVLPILQTENLKRKKPVGLTGVFFIIFTHPYSRRELLHGRRKPTSSQATARSDFTSKAKRRFEWRCEEKAAPFEWSCASHSEVKPSVFALTGYAVTSAASLFFCLQKKGKKMVEDFSNRKTSNAKNAILKKAIKHSGVLHFFWRRSGDIIFIDELLYLIS